MTGPAVIYEVSLDVEHHVAPDFEIWLKGHVDEMLALPGFVDASIYQAQHDTEAGDLPETRWVVHFTLASRKELDRYLAEHAPRMRKAAKERFGQHFVASRRILSRGEIRAPDQPPAESNCRNCGSGVRGQYCARCGQRARVRMITMWELIRDVFGDVFELDSRLWRSILPLLVKPGFLTREYLEGRRVRFVPPFRMYLVLSLVFFLLLSFMDIDGGLNIHIDDESMEHSEAITLIEGEAPLEPAEGKSDPCAEGTFDLEFDWIWLSQRLTEERAREICRKIRSDSGASFLRQLLENTPTTLFFFLPLIALAMKILYPLSKRFYVEHLLFFVHYHAFIFLLLSLNILFTGLGEAIALPEWIGGVLAMGISVYIPVYLFVAMRRVYQQGRGITLFKYLLLSMAYFISLLTMFAITSVLTILAL